MHLGSLFCIAAALPWHASPWASTLPSPLSPLPSVLVPSNTASPFAPRLDRSYERTHKPPVRAPSEGSKHHRGLVNLCVLSPPPAFQAESGVRVGECPICLNNIKEPGATKCGHLFCYECIVDCIKQMRSCPTCRAKCQANQVIKLFV